MKKKSYIAIFLFACIIGGGIFMLNKASKPAITYFPLDEEATFESASTSLEWKSAENDPSYKVVWTSSSKTDEKAYLRQDASLYFANGILRGIRSKWKQDADTIRMQETIKGENASVIQTITFHHSEMHHNDNDIRSLHHMTEEQLHIAKSSNDSFLSFTVPANNEQQQWKEQLDKKTKKKLLSKWQDWMLHFNIDPDSYHAVPLTDLAKFNSEPIPSLPQQRTDQIMGQLWEGLYKNYIVPVINQQKDQLKSHVPLVLFDKQQTHLYVLYDHNGKSEKLMQQYPD